LYLKNRQAEYDTHIPDLVSREELLIEKTFSHYFGDIQKLYVCKTPNLIMNFMLAYTRQNIA
jgi:hypothetical protein